MHHVEMLPSKLFKHVDHFHDGAGITAILLYFAVVFALEKSPSWSAKSNQNSRPDGRGHFCLTRIAFRIRSTQQQQQQQRYLLLRPKLTAKPPPSRRRRTNKIKARETRLPSIFGLNIVQGRAKESSLSCEKVLPGCAWLVLSKTGHFFCTSLYM